MISHAELAKRVSEAAKVVGLRLTTLFTKDELQPWAENSFLLQR